MTEALAFVGGVVVGIGTWILKDVVAPDFLDVRRQQRAAKLQIDAERRAYDRQDEPMRRRIAAALALHVNSLRYRLHTGDYSDDEWQQAHDRLKALVESDDGVRALGEHYRPFLDALYDDQCWLDLERRDAARPPVIPPTQRDAERYEAQEVAEINDNLGHAILNFIPLLRDLNVDDADHLERQAQHALEEAKRIRGMRFE